MAILTLQQSEELIKQGVPDWLEDACEESKKLCVHVNGEDVPKYLDTIITIENPRQFELRKKFTTSNKHVFANLLRSIDKVFCAKGGNRTYLATTTAKENLLKDKLSNIQYGYSISNWIQKVQANKFYTDPNGLIFFEVKDKETYPTIKSSKCLLNYKSNGRLVEWIIFKGETRKDASGMIIPGKFFRVVDDKFDYMVYQSEAGACSIIDKETFKLQFKKVPAIINSDILHEDMDRMVSPLDCLVELADHYLTTSSVKNIYEFLHGYPIFWAYVQPCRACDGTGMSGGKQCGKCMGEGHTIRKDVSDVIKLKPPTTNDEPKLAPDVAGYVQPDLETWKEQRIELDWIWGLMHFSMWGTSTNAKQKDGKTETATAAFLDVQPVNDRLNQFADSFEDLEKKMVQFIAEFYLKESFKGCSINYGRRFLVESPDQIWSKYEAAKSAGSPKTSLDYLLTQFYQAEFNNDIESLTVAMKGIKIEPFIHKSDEEVDKLTGLTPEDKLKKYHFNEWFKNIAVSDILTKDVVTLQKEFDKYMVSIILKSKQNAGQKVSGI